MTDEEREKMMTGVRQDNQMSWGGNDKPTNGAVQIGLLTPAPAPAPVLTSAGDED